jgi:hypothetical protein
VKVGTQAKYSDKRRLRVLETLWLAWPAADNATVSQRYVTSGRFQTQEKSQGETTAGWHDLVDLAMCAALSIFNRISFDRKEVEKRLAPASCPELAVAE